MKRNSPEDIYHLSKLAIMEYLTSGITANADMYLTPDTMIEASRDCGYRTTVIGAVNNFTQSVELLDEWYKNITKKENRSISVRISCRIYNKERDIRRYRRSAEKYKAPVYTHNSESESEVAQCIERTKVTPTVYMDRLGIFNYGGGFYHCVHMTQNDLDIVKRTQYISDHKSSIKSETCNDSTKPSNT